MGIKRFLLVVLLSDISLAQWIDVKVQAAAREEMAYLFDQSGLQNTDEESVIAEYQSRKLKLFGQRQWNDAVSLWPQVVILGVGILTWPWVKTKAAAPLAWLNSKSVLAQGSMMGFGFAFGQLITQLVSSVTNKGFDVIYGVTDRTKEVFFACTNYNSGDIVEVAQLAYVKHKQKLSPGFQKRIEDKFADLRLSPSDDNLKKETVTYVQNVLKLPTEIKESNRDVTTMVQSLGFYPSETKASLARVLAKQMANADVEQAQGRFSFYFVGPPGTGKSRAAELLAETMKMSIVMINLDEIKEDELFGSKTQPGVIAEAMMRHGQKNLFLFFDEAHHALNQKSLFQQVKYEPLFKRLLDPAKPSYKDLYFQEEIDLSKSTIVLAANEVIADRALRNRVLEAEFKPFPKWYKKHVVWKEIVPSELKRYNSSDMSLGFEDLSVEHINALVDKDAEPGFRNIQQRLFEYVSDMFLKKRNGGKEQLADDEVPFSGALSGPFT